jgi:hypothetical protein
LRTSMLPKWPVPINPNVIIYQRSLLEAFQGVEESIFNRSTLLPTHKPL